MRDHAFVRSTNPNFGSAFGGACDHEVDGVTCGWPERAHPQAASPTFNPAYRVARCGQLSNHGPHVMEHGPDRPRNCPGTGGSDTALKPTGGGS